MGDSVVTLTSNTTPSPYVAAASSAFNSTYAAWKAFDGSVWTYWSTENDVEAPCWLSYEFGADNILYAYAITARDDAADGAPRSWTLEGYNGTGWDILDTQTDVTDWTDGETKTYNYAQTEEYTTYRLNVSANNGRTTTNIATLALFAYLQPATGNITVSTGTPTPGTAAPVSPLAADPLVISGGTPVPSADSSPRPTSGQLRITAQAPTPFGYTYLSFSGTTPQMTGTWEFGDEISFDVEMPGHIGSFEGGGGFSGRTPFPHFTGEMEMEQYGSFSGLTAAMGFSGQGGAQFSGRSAVMQGGFTLELEQYGSFGGKTPDMHGSFVVDQAGTFSGITPAMRADFTGDMEQYGSFSGLTPAIYQFVNRVDWEEINFSGFTPDMQFSGAIEEDPNISFEGETPPMTGNFFITLLDSTQVGDDTIIRHRRGYDRG